jgi:citrate lyase beta subunit
MRSGMTKADAIREDPRLIRMFFESPILDSYKWQKAQTLSYDALLVDLEDTVAPHRKAEARELAVAALNSTPSEEHVLIPRVNSRDTQFFDDDLVALARTNASIVAYPKLQSVDELEEVLSAFDEVGLHPDIFASVESAAGVQNVDSFAAHERVRGLMFGPADLALDMGMPMGPAKDLTAAPLAYARSRVVTAAAANKIASITIAFPSRMKDLDETRHHVEHCRSLGFTGMITFYPPHLDLIRAEFTPSADVVAKARESVDVYSRSLDEGLATAYLASGELVLAFDYEMSKEILRRADIYAPH